MNYDIQPSKEIAVDVRLAKYSISAEGNPANDEAMINAGAYHAQQAVEKCLKFYLRDVFGEDETDRRFRIHDISTLCTRLKDRYDFSVDNGLFEMADDITEWEANSRYNHSLVTERTKIEKAILLAENIIDKLFDLNLWEGDHIFLSY